SLVIDIGEQNLAACAKAEITHRPDTTRYGKGMEARELHDAHVMQIADHHETHGFSELLVQALEDGPGRAHRIESGQPVLRQLAHGVVEGKPLGRPVRPDESLGRERLQYPVEGRTA